MNKNKDINRQASASEAVLVPNDSYFTNPRYNNAQGVYFDESKAIQIGEFTSYEEAEDYWLRMFKYDQNLSCLLYTSDAADES